MTWVWLHPEVWRCSPRYLLKVYLFQFNLGRQPNIGVVAPDATTARLAGVSEAGLCKKEGDGMSIEAIDKPKTAQCSDAGKAKPLNIARKPIARSLTASSVSQWTSEEERTKCPSWR